GTGTVYLCRHTMIERDVAVKVLHDDQAIDPDAVARFFQEAKAAADIGHPNIITIIDFGEVVTPAGPRAYLMMEALAGRSLDKQLRKGGLSLADIAHILEQVCSALAASHGKGIIHRDLKPSNVFLCDRVFDRLFVKLLDFGTAKLTTPDPGARRTQFGMVLGTPAYMSPEQCEGKGAIDHRSDIYSLGVMLYEMLTGTLPFDGDVRELLLAHLHAVPAPPRARNPAIPPEWEALCLRMIEKPKTARFQSITEVVQALADLPAHAAAYQAYVTARAASGHSGHTQLLPAEDGPGAGPISDGRPAAPAAAAESRPTLHVHVDHSERTASPPTLTAVCTGLCEDPRHDRFLITLLTRPEGRWYEVGEVCTTSGTATPPLLPRPTHVTWVDHPHGDPSMASIVFCDLRTGWSTVVLTARRRR
ncbi:MAG TPA: serine/threonine-protein kinase, partial [Kofleriaceae bacterium]|nr:serine/threonine-protein kinase [Kofleriaceae bacterium]